MDDDVILLDAIFLLADTQMQVRFWVSIPAI
jgi:hypothetical protein